jgi:23S rRNA-intervening sequence protein
MAGAYQDLIAWRKATELALEIYRSTRTFPKDELYGLTSQMRRAAVSVARARGSLLELQTQVFIAGELNYPEALASRRIKDEADELGRILNGLTTSVQNRCERPSAKT